MAADFSQHYFCFSGNERLAFENSAPRVKDFIAARLLYQGAMYAFSPNWIELEHSVRVLINAPAGVEYIVIADVMNPFTDFDLVDRMTESLRRTRAAFCRCDGAVPGTEVRAVLSVIAFRNSHFSLAALDSEDGVIVRWESQTKHNNQLNLYKYKRLKMFLALVQRFEDLPSLSVSELLERLARDDAFALLAAFGDDLRQINYDQCPHCNGGLTPLTNAMSQPFCGYLPVTRPIYYECDSCGLVVQSPSVHEDDVHNIYDKWDKQDFVASTNNPYTADSIRCDFSKILDSLPARVRTLDLGGGLGNFSKFLHASYPAWDITHSDFELKAQTSSGVNARSLDFTRNPIGVEQYDLITAWEVIEHVPYFKLSYVLRNIYDALSPGGYFVFSTPDFDSPVCKSFDFYALCPPFHYLVFGERWLRRYFAESTLFEVHEVKHCSDFLDDALNWYSYGSKTCPSMAVRSTAELLRAVFEMDVDKSVRNRLAAAGLGTEIIMTLRKKTWHE